jgi:hypothetical protein
MNSARSNMLRYYQSYDKLKPHDGCKKLCHRLGFVSVLTHGPQLDIDVLNVYNASARLVHHNYKIKTYHAGKKQKGGCKRNPNRGPCRYDNVTLSPLLLQLGLRIGPIQRMGAN